MMEYAVAHCIDRLQMLERMQKTVEAALAVRAGHKCTTQMYKMQQAETRQLQRLKFVQDKVVGSAAYTKTLKKMLDDAEREGVDRYRCAGVLVWLMHPVHTGAQLGACWRAGTAAQRTTTVGQMRPTRTSSQALAGSGGTPAQQRTAGSMIGKTTTGSAAMRRRRRATTAATAVVVRMPHAGAGVTVGDAAVKVGVGGD